MIIRIKINGFKSLVDTELYFGPFTCIAGANAVGKSNLFDALIFLSHLADKTILEAAKSIRSENQKHANVRDIFFRNGEDYLTEMSFEIDMLIPQNGIDDLGQNAVAAITSLRYTLILKLNEDANNPQIEILKEELIPIYQRKMQKIIHFPFDDKNLWLDSVLKGERRNSTPFISTIDNQVRLHQDLNQGRTMNFIAPQMPRTLISTVTAASPTAFLVRQEMRSWTMLQFEPSALRQPNTTFEVKNAAITANGLNLPATLYRLHNEKKDEDVYQQLTNELKTLVDDVTEISVDKDEKRDLLTLYVKFKGNFSLPAQSLSDGTLRFLGLAIIKADNARGGLICMEEPENGINPKKISQIVSLLEGMAMSTDYAIGQDNPFRQIIINTHSPLVVRTVADESLYLAKFTEQYHDGFQRKIKGTSFAAMQDTWKTNNELVSKTNIGAILVYLDENTPSETQEIVDRSAPIANLPNAKNRKRTVAQNIDSQLKLFAKPE